MTEGIGLLSVTALSVGFLHTLLGPDHYIPFIAMARIGRWSLNKTVVVTLLCGLGHVLSSIALGSIGIAFGIAVLKLEDFEAFRGDVAGWLLTAFGLVYFLWGIRRAIRNRPHTHPHAHTDGTVHIHRHVHQTEHLHPHADRLSVDSGGRPSAADGARASRVAEDADRAKMTPWILFSIFLFGPCEPLIPLLMYPAAEGSLWDVALVAILFGVATLVTMIAVVTTVYLGVKTMPFARYQRYGHALAGFAVLACGLAVKVGL